MKTLFGTDGIRGLAGEFPLDNKTVWIIGRALANILRRDTESPVKFVVGRDTRKSGPEIELAFASGAESAGAVCISAGIITTPGVAYLAATHGFDAGIVISASHNPYKDNGIKIFSPTGKKVSREIEEVIENAIHENDLSEFSLIEEVSSQPGLVEDYEHHFQDDFGSMDLTGKKIVADTANGAAYSIAPDLFRRLGAEVFSINDNPDGENINRDCGSLHIDALQEKVRELGADIGVAFDGDADRALFVDENANIVDGDATLWIMANLLSDSGSLKSKAIVATVMSNLGLELALKEKGIALRRTDVGDKYVLEELLASDLSVGGEQSGHIIFPSRSLVGDGIQTALFLLEAMTKTGESLSSLTAGLKTYPQILVNVRVGRKLPFEEVPEILNRKAEVEEKLGESGRLLLRYSGTENLARVMIEGAVQEEIEFLANDLAKVIGEALP
ncbi:MAG: phosphoglucosamine mutase [Pyrinomonadaceae bacterium]